MCSSVWEIPVQTHSLSSSKVFTEYRGELGSRCRTSTWFLFRTRERRIILFSRDCSARSTLSPSFLQTSFSLVSGAWLPTFGNNQTLVKKPPPWQQSGKIWSADVLIKRKKNTWNELTINIWQLAAQTSNFFAVKLVREKQSSSNHQLKWTACVKLAKPYWRQWQHGS